MSDVILAGTGPSAPFSSAEKNISSAYLVYVIFDLELYAEILVSISKQMAFEMTGELGAPIVSPSFMHVSFRISAASSLGIPDSSKNRSRS